MKTLQIKNTYFIKPDLIETFSAGEILLPSLRKKVKCNFMLQIVMESGMKHSFFYNDELEMLEDLEMIKEIISKDELSHAYTR